MSEQKRYAYLIGANGPQTERLEPLKYAENDVQRLAEALCTPRCAFTEVQSKIAVNPQSVLADLNRFVKQCEPSDLLLVHFSGHGFYDGQLFLLCNNTDIDDCISSAIKINDIKSYLDKCEARNKVLVLDCCHAGAAYSGSFKGDQDIKSTVQQALGRTCVILLACERLKTTRELETLDGGAGFLSWALTAACTSRFGEVSPDNRSLSLTDIWHWISTKAFEDVKSSLQPNEQKLDPPIMLNKEVAGGDRIIWLTEQRRAVANIPISHEQIRKQYLEKISARYNAVTLPIGPEKGIPLQAIFQPLALRRDPLTADLEHKQQRALLGEEREYEWSEYHRKDGLGAKEPSVIAEHSEDALRKSPNGRLVILGGPGTGKTTTLKHLIGRQVRRALAHPKDHIPIFVSLADLAQDRQTLQRYLFDQVVALGIERSYADILWNEIQHGHAFVAFDSLDEVAPEHRPRMIELVNSCASEHGNVWIVGSRFTEYKGGQFKQGQFSEWELLPMDASLRRELATKLLPEIVTRFPPPTASSPSPMVFVTLIENHPHAAAWGDNPLLFSLAAVVFVKTGGLPASRAALYHEVIEAVLTLREPHSISRASLRRMLAGLALWLQQGKGRKFTSDDLLTFLEERQKISGEKAESFAKRMVISGILDVIAHDTYCFRHQTFQEYLAAVEIARQLTSQDAQVRENMWQFIWKKRMYSRWTEVLRLMIGKLAQLPGNKGHAVALRWIRALLEQRDTEEGDPGELGLALALKSAVEVTEIPEWKSVKAAQLERQLVRLWWRELLGAVRNGRNTKARRLEKLVQDVKYLQLCDREATSKPIVLALREYGADVKKVAINLLQELSDWVSIHVLLPMLQDTNGNVREAVVQVLRVQGERVPLEAVLPLLQDKNGKVREAAIEVLGAWRARVPLEALLPLLQDKDRDVRRAAVHFLGVQGERVLLEALLPLLQDTDRNVRWAVVQVLRIQGERVPLEALLPLLQDKDEEVRDVAIEVLRARGEHVLDALLPLLDDVRQAAIEILRVQGEHVPLDVLMSLFQDTDWNARQLAIEVLMVQGEHMPLDVLLSLLEIENTDWDVRRVIVEVLMVQGESIPQDVLLSLLEHTNGTMRWAAVEILKAQGKRIPQDVLLPLLENTDWNVRWAVVEILRAQRKRIPLDVLLSLLQDTDWNVRWAAIEVLGIQGERVSPDVLLSMFSILDEDAAWSRQWTYEKMRWAVEVLRAQGERVSLDLLLSMLEDKGKNVRRVAIEVLGVRGEHIPLEALLPMLQDKDRDVRRATIEVLRAQKERISFEQLMAALWKPCEEVRQAAIQVLMAQGERVSLDLLLSMLEDKDKNVRWAAIEVLGARGERVPLEALLSMFSILDEDTDSREIVPYGKVRRATVQVLRAQGERVPLDVLLPLLQDKDGDVRQSDVQVLRVQEERVPLEVLLSVLEDKGKNVRRAAIEVLRAQGEHMPLDVLLSLLENTDGNVREAVVEVLRAQGEHMPLDVLLSLLENTDGNARQLAIEVLRTQGEHMPLDVLLSLLENADWNARQLAIEVLRVRGERVLDALLLLLDDVRQAAIEVLRVQRERVSLEMWLSLLENADWNMRQVVVEVLKAQGEHMPLGVLLSLLENTDWDVQWAVAEVLKAQGERVSLEMLLPLLENADWNMRQVVVEVLKAQGERVSLEMLLPLLENTDWDVQRAVAEVLKAQGERVSLEMWLSLLENAGWHVRWAVIEVLRARGERVSLEILLPLLENTDRGVRQAALNALGKRIPIEKVLDTLKDEVTYIHEEALSILKEVAPVILSDMLSQAIAVLQGELIGEPFISLQQLFIAKTLGELGLSIPILLEKLTELLEGSFWQVRLHAIEAVEKIRRHIPDPTIQRLYDLRRNDPVQAVRNAADDTLAEILSLETGIEDD